MNLRIWLILICLFSILPSFGQSLPSYVPTNGLMGWWPLDGNANDISGNGYNGTAYGVTATVDRHGNSNSAFSFDITSTGWGSAKDRIVITDDAIANAWYQANAFTISTWIKLDTKTGSFANRPHTILGIWGGNGTAIIRHQISASNYQSTRLNSTVGGTTAIANNDWVHVVTTWDGDTLRHYQNGLPAGHSHLSYSIPSSTNYGDITFGELHMGNGHWYHFVGSMDDMGVWDRALTEQEIEELFEAVVPCTEVTIMQSDTTICFGDPVTLNLDVFDNTNYIYLGSSNTSRYYIDNSSIGWTSARTAAQAAGADLVVIEDSNEQNLLYSFISDPTITSLNIDGFHIGYFQDLQSPNYTEPGGGWTWVNGNSTYTNWANNEPSNSGCGAEHWGLMYTSGLWNDQCDGTYGNDLRAIIEVPIYPSVSNLSWSTGSTQSFITVSPTQATTYWIETIENGNVCRDSIYVDINHPQVTVTNPTTCGNQSDSSLLSLSGFTGQKLTPIDSIEGVISTNWSKQINTVPGQDYILEISGLFTYGTYCPSLVTDPAFGLPGFYGRTSPQPRGISPDVSGLYVLGDTLTRPSPDIYNASTHTYYYPFTASGSSITVGWYDSGSGDNCGSASFKLSKVNQSTLWSTGQTEDEIWVKPNVSTNYWVAQTLGNTTCTNNASVNILPKDIVGGDTTVCEGTELTLSGSGGFSLNGANNYIVLDQPGPTGQSQRSFSVWFKTTATNDMTIFGYGSSGCRLNAQLRLNHDVNYSASYMGNSCPYTKGLAAVHGCHNANFDAIVSDNQWHHVAYVMGENNNYAFNNIKLYLDGQLISNSTQGCFHNWGGWQFNTGGDIPITIGKNHGGNNGYFNGEIDDFAVFDTALTANEIQSIYSNGVDLNTSHLLSYFNFENIVGDSIFDLKGNNHGKIYGALNPAAASSPNSGMSYLWSTGDTTSSITFNAQSSASYWLKTTLNGASCYDTITVEVLPSKIIASDSLYCSQGDSALLYVNNTGLTSGQVNPLSNSLSNGLVAWYPFNGNANDESGNGNHGAVNGAVLTQDRYGSSNSAYYFSSSGCATRIDALINTSSITSGLTIQVWAMRSGNGCINPRLLEFYANGGAGQAQWSWTNSIAIGSTTSSGYIGKTLPTRPDSIWTQLVYTNDGNFARFYQDGVLIDSLVSNGVVSLSGNAAFGRMNHSAWDAFNGNLDDIGVWNRALTKSEINTLYNQPNIHWSTSEINDSIYIPLDSTLQYYVVTNQNGTTCSDSITISVNQGIQASDTTICDGENVTLSTVSGQSAIWSTGDTASSITVNPATTTKYWATTSYINGTCSDTLTVFVNDPSIESQANFVCEPNDSVLLWIQNDAFEPHLNNRLQNGLVAWYPFNGNAKDKSGNGYNLNNSGATLTEDRFGTNDAAYYFDGVNDYMDVPMDQSLAFTVSIWIKPLDNTNKAAQLIYQHKNTCIRGGGVLFGLNPSNKLRNNIMNCGSCSVNSCSNYSVTTSIDAPKNDWVHFVFVRTATDTLKVFKNGTLVSTDHDLNLSVDYGTTPFRLGHWEDGTTSIYTQAIKDDIAVWNRSLTTSEVQLLYSLQNGPIKNWSTSQTNDSIWVNPSQTTTYWVNQTLNGKSCSDSVTIVVNQGIQASDTTICYGNAVTLSTVSGQSAIWSTGDTATTITVNLATTTKYWATTSYIDGTCSDTLTVFVNATKINSNDLYSCAPQDSVLLYNSNQLNSACSPLQGSLALNSNGWYPFCGNSEDLSSSQNNAIVNGAVLTDDRLGGTNSAYYFDGVGDYLKIFNNASNNYGSSSISMAAWVKIPTVSNPQQAPIIGNYISTTTAAFNLMVGGANELNPGKLNFFARNSSGAEMNLWSTTRIDDDQWHHVAIVRNSTNDSAFLYIDGTINRKSAIASGSFDSFQGFVIGGAHLNRYLKCTIDEIATWRRALSSSEIHQLATQAPSISNWSTGQSTDSIWVKPTQTTTYWIEQSLNGVTCTDSATVFINKVNIEPSLPTICTPGDSILLYAPGVEQGFGEPNCNSGYVGLRPTYSPGESISGYSYKGMYNGHHYYLADSPGSWTDAAAAAKIAGGHLVCIDDVNEQNFVANLSTGNLWLGYYRTPTNAWAWVNCQTSTYTNWRSGEPGTSEPYAHIITDNCGYNGGANQWNDIGNLSNNGVCYSNCYGVLEIDPDEIGFGQNSQVLSWSNGASNDSIWLTPNQDGDYWLTSYVNGEGCSDTVSLRVLNPAITAPTTTSCSPGDSVMLYYSGNREFSGLDTIAVPDQLIGQVTKPMTALWTQSWNVTPNQTYIMKVSGLYDVCCGSQGCLDAAFLTLNCYSQSQQSASNPCSSGGWWIFNDDCGIRPDNDVYNPSHEYYYTIENTDGTIDLSFSDNVGDNSGSLTFTLYSTKQKVVRTYNDTITWSTGETSDTIWVNPTSTSTYSVTASRGGVNCLDSIQIDVTTLSNFDPLIPTRIHCEATNTVLDGTDASAISYNWSTGEQTSSTTVNASGQYWVQATDNLGCSFSDTTQVWLSNIQSNLSSVEPTCYGFSNGSITPNPSGGISSYSYQWSNGDTTAALSATASGLYWVTITDSVGCSVQDSILLDEPADLTVTASAISNYNGYNIPCFGGLNGQANAVVSGGTLPYTYSWSNGSPDSIVYSLAAGTHTVNIMDSNGCITSDTVLITQPTGINTSLSSTSSYNGFDISCYGVQDGSIQIAVSGGVTPYQHYWSNGANGTSISNIGAGLYTVNTVDANGCSSVDSITLYQPNVLTSTATIVSNYNGYNVSCYGASDGSAQISAIGGNAPYTYSWSNGTTSNQNNGISAGSYSVTVTDTNGCTVQNSVVLNEPSELQISTSVTSNFNGYPISCTGANDGSALVNSNGGTAPYTILWSNGDTSLTTNNLSAGTYFVTVTDANGCSKSDSVVLSDPIGLSNLTLSASSYNGFNISCHGGNDGTISMTGVNGGTAPLSYYWNTGDSTSSITGLPVGNYTLTVTDANGCSIADSLTLDQPTLLTSNASVTSNFNGTNISCNGAMDGTAQVSGAGGVGPYTFVWNTSDTSTTISNLSAGTYTVVVTDANGCNTMDTVSLTEPSLLSITAGVQSNYNGYNISCAGGANGQVAALAIGGTGPYNYTWSNGSSSPGQSNLAAGMYIINVSDANGCSAADTLTLIEPPALSSIASVTSNYNGYNVSCQGAQDGSATVNAQGGVTPYSINWSNGAIGATVSNLGAGVHTVTIQDANGCSTNASVNLTEPGGVSVTATSSPTTCYGADDGSATLTVSGGTGNFDIQWSNGGTGLNQTGLTSNWYSYTIATSPNCFLTDSIWIDQPEPLVIQVDTVPPTCISAFDGEINVVAFGGTPGYQYFLNGTAFSGFQDELGTDSLEIVAVDMNNCDTTLILAMPAQTQSCLFIPNWFTPNGNNQEDAWRIEGFEYENLRLKVFNVMGQLIYTTESSTYIPWDGNYNGSPLPEGDYYYLIESTVNDSKYSGYVTLLR